MNKLLWALSIVIFSAIAPQLLFAMEKPAPLCLDSWKTPMEKVYVPSNAVPVYKPVNNQSSTNSPSNQAKKIVTRIKEQLGLNK